VLSVTGDVTNLTHSAFEDKPGGGWLRGIGPSPARKLQGVGGLALCARGVRVIASKAGSGPIPLRFDERFPSVLCRGHGCGFETVGAGAAAGMDLQLVGQACFERCGGF